MARGTFLLFEDFALYYGQKEHNFATDTFKLGLINNGTTPSVAQADPKWSDFSGYEVSPIGGDYPSGGVTLTGVTHTEAGGIATFDANDINMAYNASGFDDGFWGILYNFTNGSGRALGFIELDGPLSLVVGAVAINWNANGIFKLSIV